MFMKRLFSSALLALLSLSVVEAQAQQQTTTPNIHLQIPYDEEVNWGPIITSDLTSIDSVIGGTQSAIWSILTATPVKITNSSNSVVLFTVDMSGNLTLTGGGNFGGPVTLPGNPTSSLQAAPKQYVDTAVATATAAASAAQTTANAAQATANAAQTAQSGGLLKANNLSDVTNVSTARANLGLGSAAITAASAYDVAGAAAAVQAGDLQKTNNLSDLLNPVAARINLGLGSAATTAASAYDVAGAAAAAQAASDPAGTATAAVAAVQGSFLQKSNNLSDLANAATARTNLGLGTAATTAASAYDVAGAAAAVTSATLQKSSNLSDLTNTAAARTNLGLGTAATTAASAYDVAGAAAAAQAASDPSGAAAAAQAAAIAASLQKSNNLSDLANAATARTNLGLGTAAVHGLTITINSTPCSLDGSCTISGGSGTTSSAVTTNYIPKLTGTGTLGNSSLVDNGTTLVGSEPLTVPTISTTGAGTGYRYMIYGTGTHPAQPANSAGWEGPLVSGGTPYLFAHSPSWLTAGFLWAGVPTTDVFGNNSTVVQQATSANLDSLVGTETNCTVNNDVYAPANHGCISVSSSAPAGGVSITSSTTAIPVTYSYVNVSLTSAAAYSFTMAAGTDGQVESITFIQPATGTAATITPPSNVFGFFNYGSTLGKRSTQTFEYSTLLSGWFPYGGPGVINY